MRQRLSEHVRLVRALDVLRARGLVPVRWRSVLLALVATALLVAASACAPGADSRQPRSSADSTTDGDRPTAPRPLTYAEGRTIHFGDQEIDAGAAVVFVEATDDGVVFITEDDYRPGGPPQIAPLWFTDGSRPAQIGVTDVHHVYDFAVATANPGSLVGWLGTDPGADVRQDHDEHLFVYDTRRREVVAQVPATGDVEHIVVSGDRVYWETSTEVWRLDLRTGGLSPVSWSSYRAELAANPRMLAFGNASDQGGPPPVVAPRLAAFMQVGDRLVPTDSIHHGTARNAHPTERLDGRPLRLRPPDGHDAQVLGIASFTVVQWLDDDHLVLFAYHEHSEGPSHVGDILVCPVPSGTCTTEVPAAESTPYVPPGDVY